MDGLNVTQTPGVSVSFFIWPLLYERACVVCFRQMLVLSVSHVGASASLVPTCSDPSCGIWHPLKSPPPLLHRHTNTSTINRDKLGFSDFLQILLKIREDNLKALHRQRHEYKGVSLEAYGK